MMHSYLRYRTLTSSQHYHRLIRDNQLAACPDSCFDPDFVVGMVYSGLG